MSIYVYDVCFNVEYFFYISYLEAAVAVRGQGIKCNKNEEIMKWLLMSFFEVKTALSGGLKSVLNSSQYTTEQFKPWNLHGPSGSLQRLELKGPPTFQTSCR